jgi:hypothetical protein
VDGHQSLRVAERERLEERAPHGTPGGGRRTDPEAETDHGAEADNWGIREAAVRLS